MNQRVVVSGTILLVILSVIAGTSYKVYHIHQERSLLVVQKRIIEGARECVFDLVCKDEDMTLGVLIEKGYAKDEINPQTKMYYSRDSLIKKENDSFVFYGD